MNLDECHYIGYTSKVHGKQGELTLKLEVDFLEECKKLESVLIQMNKTDNSLIPFFITKSEFQNNGTLRIKLDDVDDIATAKSLSGKGIYILNTALPTQKGKQFYHHEVADFKIIDTNYGQVGEISQILNYPKQAIFEVLHTNGKEILIPVADDIINEIDRENKIINVTTPDGLIDLYLE
ncbi:MAG: 16S rRNA processing protein RimM [Flavobacteriales bacterium]|nr:MAG: 16S rRNA processing protein RimM [Flavobacteriales bacterium]